MQLKYIDALLQREWETLTQKNLCSGYMQSFFWAEFKGMLGWETYKIGIFEKNKLIGGAIISKYSHYKNFNFLSISEGPVLPYGKKQTEKMFHLLITEIDKIANLTNGKLSSHLSIEPKLETLPKYFKRFKKAKMDQQPLKTLMIDLTLSEEEILKQMKPKGRYNIKVAQKHNIKIIKTGLIEGLNDFLILYKQFAKKNKFEKKDDLYFESLSNILSGTNIANFYFARLNNQNLSTALVINYGDTASFLFGASSKKEKNTMSPYLLHWEIIKEAKKNDLKWYDFYSLSPDENNLNHPWHGFSVFKRKFGGKEVNYIGGYDFIYNKKLYKKYEKLSLSSE